MHNKTVRYFLLIPPCCWKRLLLENNKRCNISPRGTVASHLQGWGCEACTFSLCAGGFATISKLSEVCPPPNPGCFFISKCFNRKAFYSGAEQMRVRDLTQGPNSGSLEAPSFKLTTSLSVFQSPDQWSTTYTHVADKPRLSSCSLHLWSGSCLALLEENTEASFSV